MALLKGAQASSMKSHSSVTRVVVAAQRGQVTASGSPWPP
jgi:hypothetical protein